MKVCILDTETSQYRCNDRVYAHDPRQRLTAVGYMIVDTSNINTQTKVELAYEKDGNVDLSALIEDLKDTDILACHNIQFDLAFLIRDTRIKRLLGEKLKVMCTMHNEYILSGHVDQYVSLQKAAKKYGIEGKHDAVSALFKQGKHSHEIESSMLLKYLEQDVRITAHVFAEQWKQMKKQNILKYVLYETQALMATTIMAHNGMYLNQPRLDKYKDQVTIELEELRKTIQIEIGQLNGMDDHAASLINVNSPSQLLAILYGGEWKTTERRALVDADGNLVKYKTGAKVGEQRYEIVDHKLKMKQLYTPRKSTNAATLYDLQEEKPLNLIDLLLNYRNLSKQLTTYFIGMAEQVLPWTKCVHPSYNHNTARTGRLTCSKPNLQNISR